MTTTILENASASMRAIEVASRLVEGQIRTIRGRLEQALKIDVKHHGPIRRRVHSTRFQVGEPGQSQARRLHAPPRHRRKIIRRRRG